MNRLMEETRRCHHCGMIWQWDEQNGIWRSGDLMPLGGNRMTQVETLNPFTRSLNRCLGCIAECDDFDHRAEYIRWGRLRWEVVTIALCGTWTNAIDKSRAGELYERLADGRDDLLDEWMDKYLHGNQDRMQSYGTWLMDTN